MRATEVGIVGLGKMGRGIARRILRSDVQVRGFDRNSQALESLSGTNHFHTAQSLRLLVDEMRPPRIICLALPCGGPTRDTVGQLASLLQKGDLLADCGNTHYRDSASVAHELSQSGIDYVDVGVSGGPAGESDGYCLMVGGSESAVRRIEPVLNVLAKSPPTGWAHLGPSGAGHYAKMVHNAIEYGVIQALAEGCCAIQAKREFGLDIGEVLRVWLNGSLLEGRLLGLAASLDLEPGALAKVAPVAEDLGTGRMFVKEAIDLGIPSPVITAAVQARLWSQDRGATAPRIVSLLRQAFGGHEIAYTSQSNPPEAQ